MPTSPIGAHVFVAGGLPTALTRAAALGAEVVQVFLSNPRGWATPAPDEAADRTFGRAAEAAGIPVFAHVPYLVNLGSPTPLTYERSVGSVAFTLQRAARIGARGVVVHTGSCVDERLVEAGLRQVREGLLPLLDAADAPLLLLEPTAGQGRSLCARVEELGPYLDALDWHPKVGVCLDTCHAFAAGHDLATPGGAKELLDTLLDTVGAKRLHLVHANDAKDPCGSRRDRHERIGTGYIGRDAFAELLGHPAVAGVPVVIETPGTPADHAADVALLKQLAGR